MVDVQGRLESTSVRGSGAERLTTFMSKKLRSNQKPTEKWSSDFERTIYLCIRPFINVRLRSH